MIVKGH